MAARKNIQFIGMSILMTFLVSCGTKVYNFIEGNKNPEDIVIMKSAEGFFEGTVFGEACAGIYSVDGKTSPDNRRTYGSKFDGAFQIELTPGKHALSVGFYYSSASHRFNNTEPMTIYFTGQAGKAYKVRVRIHFKTKQWKAWVEEI